MARLSLIAAGVLLASVFMQLGGPRRLRLTPPDIVWIEAGEFSMGASDPEVLHAVEMCVDSRPFPIRSLAPSGDGGCSPARFLVESPRRRVFVNAFGIDRTEVTRAAYGRCVRAGRCRPSNVPDDDLRLAAPTMPVTGINVDEAARYCAFAGGRLPTETEWERAARGDRPWSRFPWGRNYNSHLANHGAWPEGPDDRDGFAMAAPVGSFPDGASPHGLLDAAGNAWEWTSSSPRTRDVGMGADPGVYRVIRGGSWSQPPEVMRVTHRTWLPLAERHADVGVRCAHDRRR
ncbi:MAG: formylglycine-generating enzyme family protein [Sandaracinaceae bacterium]